jgi:hypothetical protein
MPCTLVHKYPCFGGINCFLFQLPWRWRQQMPPKPWYLSAKLQFIQFPNCFCVVWNSLLLRAKTQIGENVVCDVMFSPAVYVLPRSLGKHLADHTVSHPWRQLLSRPAQLPQVTSFRKQKFQRTGVVSYDLYRLRSIVTSRDISACIATVWTVKVRFPAWVRDFPLLHSV